MYELGKCLLGCQESIFYTAFLWSNVCFVGRRSLQHWQRRRDRSILKRECERLKTDPSLLTKALLSSKVKSYGHNQHILTQFLMITRVHNHKKHPLKNGFYMIWMVSWYSYKGHPSKYDSQYSYIIQILERSKICNFFLFGRGCKKFLEVMQVVYDS